MFEIIKKLFYKEKKQNQIYKSLHQDIIKYRYANIDDIDFIFQCVKLGSKEGHFKYISKKDINSMVKTGNNMPNSILKIIKFNNIDIGFLYAGFNVILCNKKRRKVLKGYEINLLYIVEDYRKKV